MQHIFLSPEINELPSHYAFRLSKYYASNTKKEHKKKLGQFFTPIELSNFIASFSSLDRTKIKILDPGCGTCILSCSLIEQFCENPKLKQIELTTYEIDTLLNDYTAVSLSYLKGWLLKKKIELKIMHLRADFINENISAIELKKKKGFDIVISNPPYFKIPKEDKRKQIFKTISNGQLNIYAVFAAISINLLKTKGELIFIIPRSFASGEYFRTFRNIFFPKIQITHIHLFGSRRNNFKDDKVLQENIIIKGYRVQKVDLKKPIFVSQSQGLSDISLTSSKKFGYTQLINFNTHEKFLYLPNSLEQEKIIKLIKRQKNNLNTLGYKVSTGPIVYFRKKEFLQKEKTEISAPLYWLENVKKFSISHPMNGKSKEQFICNNKGSKSVLINNSNVVFVRRFSSKDDTSRLVAAPHLKNTSKGYDKIGIENKLNYIAKSEGELTEYECLGISSILNSSIYDEYFKTFNGNTQVSASELKKIPFPDKEKIISVGKKVSFLKIKSQDKINTIISKVLFEKFIYE